MRSALTTIMKIQRSSIALPMALLVPFTTGCQVVEAIFKAGVWVGVLGVFAVFALIVWGIKSFLT